MEGKYLRKVKHLEEHAIDRVCRVVHLLGLQLKGRLLPMTLRTHNCLLSLIMSMNPRETRVLKIGNRR
jgi:hypothetical protein